MQTAPSDIANGVITKRKRDGVSLHNLVLRTDPDTYGEVRDYALKNKCAASQAVRELVEIGLETVYDERASDAKSQVKSDAIRISSNTVRVFGGTYLAVVFGNYVLKQSQWNKNSFDLVRNKYAADEIRALIYSEAESAISAKSLNHIKSAVLSATESIISEALIEFSDQMNTCRRIAAKAVKNA